MKMNNKYKKTFKISVLTSMILLGSKNLTAFDLDGTGDQSDPSLKALYNFATSAQATEIPNLLGNADLDLLIPQSALDNGKVTRGLNFVTIDLTSEGPKTVIESRGNPADLISSCRASNELTIEMWLKNRSHRPALAGLSKVISLTKNYDSLGPGDNLDEVGYFYFGTRYNDFGRYQSGMSINNGTNTFRTIMSTEENDFTPQPSISLGGEIQHVYFTVSADGTEKLYVSSYIDDGGGPVNYVRVSGSPTRNDGNFSSWVDDTSMRLALANEISFSDPANMATPNIGVDTDKTVSIKDKSWSGDLHLLAIYCRALSDVEILGPTAPPTPAAKIPALIGSQISTHRKKAAKLYSRLVGVKTSIDNPVIDGMESAIAGGNIKQAAQIATGEPNFYNITVRDFAVKMSNRDETVNDTFNDFAAGMIGVMKDNLDARTLTYENFSYRADPAKAAVPSTPSDILASNRHYEALEEKKYNYADVLRREVQKAYHSNGTAQPVQSNNAAGLITSRAFMRSHAAAGTNRRLVEFTVSQFLCIPIEKWADPTGGDDNIGRDVDRSPGGNHAKFKTSCRSCHSVMDGMRGAFAYFDWLETQDNGSFVAITKENQGFTLDTTSDFGGSAFVVKKMNRNFNVFPPKSEEVGTPAQFKVRDTAEFVNRAVYGANQEYFRWPASYLPTGTGVSKRYGVKAFGQMISSSGAFGPCLSKRIFRTVCKREPASFDQAMLDKASNDFASGGFNLRSLFEDIASSDQCLGRDW